ncbi:Hypothetical predicted protein [Mytilus galloprovincialis]|uniref:Novel STAND NTPase 3 domain-containing protein n=1 Tax=Mytilus galloprovincialis TaxID=29158 RepID=A0A8B6BSG4_MYTGA|nr:Hypothetical predicted protein [Mytilus galloprovincialis]
MERRIHKLVLKEWKDKDEKFVKTPPSEYVSNILRTENIVTVTGQPGIGKSATIHHVALSMQRGYFKYAIIPCKNPSDILTHYKDGAYQIFVIDDVCGKYVINQYDVEEWTKYIDYIDKILKEGKTKLLATLRLQVFQETQFKRISIFSKNVCDLSSKAFLLPLKIKFKIAKAYLPEIVVKEICQSLDRYDYLPLLCLLYSQNSNTNALKYFENPFLMYTKELDEMHVQMNKTKLCALLLLVVFDGCIFERTIREEKFRQTLELIFDSCNVMRGTPTDSVIHELNTLLGTYLELRVSQKKDEVESTNFAYHAVHDKMFDFLCCYFGGKFQKCILQFSDDNIICCRMQLKSLHLPENREVFEIMIEKDNEQAYFDRIVDMLSKGKIFDIVCNRQMPYEVYRTKLISQLQLLTNDKIKTLLNAQDKNEKTLAYLVCLKGYTDLVQFILERTADINADHFSTYPPLVGACERGDDIIVQLLISKGANVNKSDVSKHSPLIMALKGCHNSDIHGDGSTNKNHSLIIDLLIENGALMDNLEEFYQSLFIQKNVSPLIGASSLGKLCMVKRFIQRGDSLDETDAREFTPLHWAIYNCHHNTAKYLIDIGSNIHVIEQDGRNAFMLACYSGCTEIVEYLLSKEFNVNEENDRGWTPLLYAINGMGESGNSAKTVTFLTDIGANERFCNKDGVSPLMLSCKHGSYKITESILKKHKNMDTNDADVNGITALMYASMHGHTDICNLLISKKANIHAVDKFEWTCLMWACFMGYESTAELFISAGLEINKKDILGNTALLLASQCGNTKILCLLISNGANASVVNTNGSTAIILALKNGNISTANFLITKGAHVTEKEKVKTSDTILSVADDHITASALNPADKNINTALKVAAVEGNTETASLLLRKGIDVNVIDNDRNTALLLAIMGGHSETVDLLIRNEADINNPDVNVGNSALLFVAGAGHKDTVDLLITKGADINTADKNGNTALLLAARSGNTDTVVLLLTIGADLSNADKYGNTALILAAGRSHTDTVDLIIAKGADINAANNDGNTAFLLAAERGHTETVDLLLTKGADMNAANNNRNTAFLLAAERGHTDTVDLLLTKGADLNAAFRDGYTAFLLAASFGKTETVDLLLTKGADVNAADKVGRTALILAITGAAELGHTKTVDLLLTKGADVNAADKVGRTALILAITGGHSETVDLLLTKGADVNAADEDGDTSLLIAAELGHTKTVDLLLTKEADVNAADKVGKTALILAITGGHSETVDLLLTKGADVNAADEDETLLS